MASRTHVEVTPQELFSIVKAYSSNRGNWVAVLQAVKKDFDDFPAAAKELYDNGKFEKLKRRMADQVKKATKEGFTTKNQELRDIISSIKERESRYSTKGHPAEKRKANKVVFLLMFSF